MVLKAQKVLLVQKEILVLKVLLVQRVQKVIKGTEENKVYQAKKAKKEIGVLKV